MTFSETAMKGERLWSNERGSGSKGDVLRGPHSREVISIVLGGVKQLKAPIIAPTTVIVRSWGG